MQTKERKKDKITEMQYVMIPVLKGGRNLHFRFQIKLAV